MTLSPVSSPVSAPADVNTILAGSAAGGCAGMAEALNVGCQCVSLDRQALLDALARDPRDGALQAMLAESRPHLFSDSMAFVSARHVRRMADVVAAIESALPA